MGESAEMNDEKIYLQKLLRETLLSVEGEGWNTSLINQTFGSHLFNQTQEQFRTLEYYMKNRNFDGARFYIIIVAYSLLISFGVFGNIMVVSAVIRKSAMRTVRNMFIVNLAVSDLLLCAFTMPLTLIEIITVYWPFGEHVIVCKVVGCLQAVSIFVSAISITAIALDRYHVIVYPTRASVKRLGAAISLVMIWLLACALAAPLFMSKYISHHELDLPAYGLDSVNFCLEEWPFEDGHGQTYYSIFSFVIQYIVPIIVVTFVYSRICIKLHTRMRPGGRFNSESTTTAGGEMERSSGRDTSRVRRTNTLLISITLIFVISWMPLNVFNLIVYIYEPFTNVDDVRGGKEKEMTIYAVCHLAAGASSCANPVLYGWLNENFRKEFLDIWATFKRVCCRSLENNNGNGRRAGSMSMRGATDNQAPVVHYKKSKVTTVEDGELEQSTLITQVLDRHK